ncbi:MAG: hypothetical protein WD032_10940 [Nitrospirales bacterium]
MNSADELPLVIGWKVSTLSPIVASVRYRALLPMLALEEQNVKSRLFANGDVTNLDGLDLLIIIKSFSIDDVSLAHEARVRGIPLVFDLCDNIFVDGYGKSTTNWVRDVFFSITKYASAIVTSTAPLADEIRRQSEDCVPIYIVPDGIETQPLVELGLQRLKAAQLITVTREKGLCVDTWDNVIKKLKSLRGSSFKGILFRMAGFCRRKFSVHALKIKISDSMYLYKTSRNPQAIQVQLEPSGVPDTLGNRCYVNQAPIGGETATHINKRIHRILWFGHHGAPYASFGMLDLLHIRKELEAIAVEFPVELIVVSNNFEKFLKFIQPIKIPSRYVEWSVEGMAQHVKNSDIVVVPNTCDPFSYCKSSNRTVLALACCVPVVATSTPALTDLRECIQLDDFIGGLRRYLSDRDFAKRQADCGRKLVQELYGQAAIGQAWLGIIEKTGTRTQGIKVQGGEFIFVLNLIQDLELVVPVLKVALRRSIPSEVWCSFSLFKNSPRVRADLEEVGVPWRIWSEEFDKWEISKSFHSAKVLLTASESSLEAHQFSYSLTKIAKELGIITGTLQHGLENVGLTYSDERHSIKKVDFASDRIYLWGPLKTLHAEVPIRTLKKCMSVGCTKIMKPIQTDLSSILPKQGLVVGIFENLHWHRYSGEYQVFFIEGVRRLARDFPSVTFVMKSHPAGRWLISEYSRLGYKEKNLIIVDQQKPTWQALTVPQIISNFDAVITSPSTVAFDAARMGVPVALVAHSLTLDNYSPLFIIGKNEDWQTFLVSVTNASSRRVLQESNKAFIDRVHLDGNAAENIVDDLIGCLKAQKKKAI